MTEEMRPSHRMAVLTGSKTQVNFGNSLHSSIGNVQADYSARLHIENLSSKHMKHAYDVQRKSQEILDHLKDECV